MPYGLLPKHPNYQIRRLIKINVNPVELTLLESIRDVKNIWGICNFTFLSDFKSQRFFLRGIYLYHVQTYISHARKILILYNRIFSTLFG
jgi:hypothetical protein